MLSGAFILPMFKGRRLSGIFHGSQLADELVVKAQNDSSDLVGASDVSNTSVIVSEGTSSRYRFLEVERQRPRRLSSKLFDLQNAISRDRRKICSLPIEDQEPNTKRYLHLAADSGTQTRRISMLSMISCNLSCRQEYSSV